MTEPQKLTPAEMLNFSTIRLECDTPDGVSTGTGFFFKFCEEESGQYIPAIVTNKHVVARSTSGRFHFHLSASAQFTPPLQHTRLELPNFGAGWIDHPDPDVDLCVSLIGPLLHHAKQQGQELFYLPLENSLIPSGEDIADFQGLEDIVMIGYPNGLWDAHNNMPIMRRGTAATHPKIDYDGKREFLIDAACFPGSSGSPVLLFDRGTIMGRNNSVRMGQRIKLLGVLYAGPQHTAEGEIVIMSLPTAPRPVAFSNIPNNLGIVIKSERLMEFDSVIRSLTQQIGT